ncbi:MAG: guanylate kinase [Erysipelotrichaceae bacterium]|nr:guanylate kinase [Erysipelotrichaceae bacterium]MBQ1810874.1 guanylate kinase [Erysipelotrichaceae bacterium]
MKKGLLIVFSGPSGVGKGTILKELQKDERLKLVYSVSMTTRKPREGEVDGVNYFFVTKKRFKEAIKNNELLEYAEYVRNYYGTPRFFVEEQRKKGNNVILEIEIQGAKQIIAKEKDLVSVFITPPSLEELEARIRGRKSGETDEIIEARINQAREELANVSIYDHVICNDDLTKAIEDVRNVLLEEIAKNEENEK